MTARFPAIESEDMLLNLAEQIKQPWTQIVHAAELLAVSADEDGRDAIRRSIATVSRSALELIDGYLLSVELQRGSRLELEPVSLSSVLYDTAENLQDIANDYGCRIELRLGGKYGPVMTHRRAVEVALTTLGLSFIENAASLKAEEQPIISLELRRNAQGISPGVYAENEGLSAKLLNRARELRGVVHQPFVGFDSGTGTGIFIADSIFSSLETNMRVARSGGLQGLAATLLPSRQLSLV